MTENNSTTELADNDVRVFEEIRIIQERATEEEEEEDSVIMHQQRSEEEDQRMKNLQEMFAFMQSQGIQGKAADHRVIKPIKILSPVISEEGLSDEQKMSFKSSAR